MADHGSGKVGEWLTKGSMCARAAGAEGYTDREPSPKRAHEEGAEDDGAEARARPAALAGDDAGERE